MIVRWNMWWSESVEIAYYHGVDSRLPIEIVGICVDESMVLTQDRDE